MFAQVTGGVCAPKGIRASATHAGFRKNPQRLDTALVVAEGDAVACAGMFTRNVFCAAPVQVSREVAAGGRARAVILNSGNANAATGEPGLEIARKSQAFVASALGLVPGEVFVASTGVIGVPLPFEPFENGMDALLEELSEYGGHDAACAIMTTDTRPKEYVVRFTAQGHEYAVGGMAKGSGMIQPDMATMLSVVTTDAPVSAAVADAALRAAVNVSFNKVTVDSDTSTNDSVFFLASGAAGGEPIVDEHGEPYEAFAAALRDVCENLARQIAADGEGATKLVTVNVTGAANEYDADTAARTIANSPLVKTAVAGHDCNWGRIAAALGRSGVAFKQEEVDIDIMGLAVLRSGLPCGFDEDEALRRFEQDEIVIDVALREGVASTQIWTCDFTHDYITINADYRT